LLNALIVSPSLIGSLAACQPINENQTLQTCAHHLPCCLFIAQYRIKVLSNCTVVA
jgi:hypothetical protein